MIIPSGTFTGSCSWRHQPITATTTPGRIGVVGIRGLRLNAVRHCTYYCQPCMINRCTRHVWLFVIYRALMDIVVDYPCIADMHGMYFFCQPTLEYIVAYRASDMHGIYCHIVPFVYYGVYLLSGIRQLHRIRLLLMLVFLSERICVVGICCGCPPFFPVPD